MPRTLAGTRTTAGQRQVARDFKTCLHFDGSSAAVTTALWSTATTNFTLSAWFKTDDWTQTRQPIISNGSGDNGGSGYALVLNGNGATDGSMHLEKHQVAWISLGFKVQDNNWHHILMSVDPSGNVVVYLDGVSRFTSGSQSLGTPTVNSYIGKDNFAGGWFKGSIDEARYYSSGLSATDAVNTFFGVETGGVPTNWYKFDEGSGTSQTDSGTSPKTGTSANATYSSNVVMTARTAVG